MSDVCRIFGPNSRTERPWKTKIGIEIAYVTCDLYTTFKVKRSRSPGHFTHRRVNASISCSGERGNLLTVGTYCYVAVGSAARGASALTEGGEGRGHIAAAPTLMLSSAMQWAYRLFSHRIILPCFQSCSG